MTSKTKTAATIFEQLAKIIESSPDDQSYMFESLRDQIKEFLEGKYDIVAIHLAEALEDDNMLITVKKGQHGASLIIHPECTDEDSENQTVTVRIDNTQGETPFIYDMSKKSNIQKMLAKIQARLDSGIELCKAQRKPAT